VVSAVVVLPFETTGVNCVVCVVSAVVVLPFETTGVNCVVSAVVVLPFETTRINCVVSAVVVLPFETTGVNVRTKNYRINWKTLCAIKYQFCEVWKVLTGFFCVYLCKEPKQLAKQEVSIYNWE